MFLDFVENESSISNKYTDEKISSVYGKVVDEVPAIY